MTPKLPVLLFGDDTRSFLATVRSLGRRGVPVHVAPYSLSAPALRSRYIRQVHRIPYYLGDGAAWLDAVREVVRREGIGMIVACEERSMLPLMRHRDQFGPCLLALPKEPAFTAFFDKLDTHRLADRSAVPAPAYRAVGRDTPLAEIEAALAYPMVCKSRRSYDWPDLYVRTKVRICRNRAELADWLARCPPGDEPGLIEAFTEGFGLGLSVLCREGEVLQAFEHHRVTEMDGSSFCRVSRPVHGQRLQAVQRLVAAVGYTGLAMFEFKEHAVTGQWALLEVNARPWGSMPLPVALGIDFPFGMYQVLRGDQPELHRPYATGVQARNLVADFHQVRARMAAQPGAASALGVALAWLLQLPRVLVGREHWDTLTLDDPRPGLDELRQLARSYAGRLARLTGSGRHQPAPPLPGPAPGAPPKVMFLCQGNICRSPYAEWRARQLAEQAGVRAEFISAGTLPRNPRPSPPEAVAAAAQRGIGLVEHRSRHAEAASVAWADLIVYFDDSIRAALLDRHPEAADRLVHIAALAPADPAAGDIDDPYGHPAAAFGAAYDAIDRLLAAWPLLQPAADGGGHRVTP